MVGPRAVRYLWIALAATGGAVGFAQAPIVVPPAPATSTPAPPVTLGVAVTNAGQDRYLDDLTAAEFRVVEDGRPQAITRLRTVRRPVSVCVVFDASMSDDQPAKRRIADATIRALSQALEPRDEIAALVMLTAADVRLPLTPAGDVTTVDWTAVRQRPWSLDYTMLAALEVLDRARHPRRVVLLVSDGIGGDRQVLLSNLVTTRFRSETTVHAIEMAIGMPPDYGRGYMPVRDRRIVKPQLFDSPVRAREPDPALERVVVEGGGLFQRIGDASEAAEAVTHLVTDLAFEYTVEYTPTSPEDGRFHRVTVEATRSGARARHRAGYLASSPDVRTTTTVELPPADGATGDAPAAPVVIGPTAAPALVPRASPSDRLPALRATYEAAVESFRTTLAFRGADTLVGRWSREMLEDAVTAAQRNEPAFAFAAATFHLEVALDVAPRSADNAMYHLRLGERLLAALPPAVKDEGVREFLDRWYGTASSIFLAQSDGPRAKEILDRAKRQVPNASRVRFVAGRIEEVAGLSLEVYDARLDHGRLRARLASAEREYRAALADDPGYVRAQVHLGRVLLALDRREEGRRLLESVAAEARSTGDRYLATLFLAADYERAGDVEPARALLEGLEAIAPNRQTSWLALAQLEQRAGRLERAREVVASHLGSGSDADEWWTYRSGGVQTEDLEWLRERLSR